MIRFKTLVNSGLFFMTEEPQLVHEFALSDMYRETPSVLEHMALPQICCAWRRPLLKAIIQANRQRGSETATAKFVRPF